jgi:glucose-1-phosphate thymidylyltransferase
MRVTTLETAVILAAGRGTRMKKAHDTAQLTPHQAEVAQTGLKALIPVGRPFIDYVLSGLADAGYKQVCLVVGPLDDALRAHVSSFRNHRLEIQYAVQQKALGTANALAAATEFVGDRPFALINSDNYYPQRALAALRLAAGSAVVGFRIEGLRRGNISDERLKSFAILSANAYGTLQRIIEKPKDIPNLQANESPLISMNCWRFTPRIFEACQAIPRSSRGEFELTDAVSYAIDVLGERFQILVENEPVLDLSTRTDIEEVSRRLASIKVEL